MSIYDLVHPTGVPTYIIEWSKTDNTLERACLPSPLFAPTIGHWYIYSPHHAGSMRTEGHGEFFFFFFFFFFTSFTPTGVPYIIITGIVILSLQFVLCYHYSSYYIMIIIAGLMVNTCGTFPSPLPVRISWQETPPPGSGSTGTSQVHINIRNTEEAV